MTPEAPREPESGGHGFWRTLPGIMTGIAALLTAVVGTIAFIIQVQKSATSAGTNRTPVSTPSPPPPIFSPPASVLPPTPANSALLPEPLRLHPASPSPSVSPSPTLHSPVPWPGGPWEIRSARSSKCLDVYASITGGYKDGDNVQQWPCLGNTNQLWYIIGPGNGTIAIISSRSGKCLEVYSSTSGYEDGANVQQWTCHGADNQLWRLGSSP